MLIEGGGGVRWDGGGGHSVGFLICTHLYHPAIETIQGCQ